MHLPDKDVNAKVIDQEFSNFVEQLLEQWGVKGLSLAVVRPGVEDEYGAWGVRSLEGEKVKPETLFGIGSCSKAFVGLALGVLIDDFASGKNVVPLPPGVSSLTWRTKIKHLLPTQWKVQDEWTNSEATLQDMLSHVTGLPGHDLSYDPNDSMEDALKRFPDLKQTHELRETYQYNNLMFSLGSFIVSKYSGQSFPDFVEKRLFSPLGMGSTTYYYSRVKDQFSSCFTHEGREIPYWISDGVIPIIGGAGGVISDVMDMAQWLKMHLNSGVAPQSEERVVSQKTFKDFTTATSIIDGGESLTCYCKGWGKLVHHGHELITHTGGCPGVSSFAGFLPQDNIGIVVLSNVGDRNNVSSAVAFRVLEKLLQTPQVPIGEGRRICIPDWSEDAVLPSLPLSSYTGTYTNAGYGEISICSPESSSESCRQILADFATIDAISSPKEIGSHSRESSSFIEMKKKRPMLYSAWRRVWGSHVRFYHERENTFAFRITTLFIEGYGKDKTPFEVPGLLGLRPWAEFVVERNRVVGFGLFGAAGPPSEGVDERPVREKADVWFDKVDAGESGTCIII